MNTIFTLIGSNNKVFDLFFVLQMGCEPSSIIKLGITNYKKDTVNEKYF